MPNWKKVVTSGSDTALNSLSMSGDIIPDQDNVHTLGTANNRFQLNGGTPVTVNGSGTANTITRFQGATTVEDSKITSSDTQTIIEHNSANNTIFIVSGSNGELLTVSDVENGGAGMLLSVNDNSGIPMFEVSGSGDLIAERLVYDDTQDFILSYNSSSGLITFVSTSAVAGDAADGYIGDSQAHTAGGNLDMNGNAIDNVSNLTVQSSIIHDTDTDTKIVFNDDSMAFNAGGVEFLTFVESGTDSVVFNQNQSDINFSFLTPTNANMFRIDGGTDTVGIGGSVDADATLKVHGSLLVTSEITASSEIRSSTWLSAGSGVRHYNDTHTNMTFGSDQITLAAGGYQGIKLTTTEVVHNENGVNVDFRMESNLDDKMFLLDASADRVHIGGDSVGTHTGIFNVSGSVNLDGGLTVNGNQNATADIRLASSGNPNMLFVSGGANRVAIGHNNPQHTLDVNGSLEATSMYVDTSIFHTGDTDTKITFGNNQMFMYVGNKSIISAATSIVTINGEANDMDFRVEGQSEGNLIYANAGTNRVGIGTDTPTKDFEVAGEISGSDIYIDDWGSVSASLADAGGALPNVGPGAGNYGSTSNGTKIDVIQLDDQGRVTSISTGATGDIQQVIAGTNLTGGGTSGTVTVNLTSKVSDVILYAGAGSNTTPSISFSETNGSDYGWYSNGFLYKTTAAEVKFTFDGTDQLIHDTDGVQITSDFAFGVGVAPSTTNGRIDASNDVVAFSSSDIRWKENIKPIENALDKVSQIGGYEFDWKELSEDERETQHGNVGHDVGVIAQEIEKVLPEVVTTRDNGFMGVKYEKIVPLLIESIKELKAEIEELKRRL